jgi:hypothetical protein
MRCCCWQRGFDGQEKRQIQGQKNRSSFLSAGVRRLVLGLALLGVFGGAALLAQSSVTLAWNASTNGVTGYRVYQGTASGVYTKSVLTPNVTQTTISNLVDGTQYYFVVTAFNAAGVESAYSTELPYTATSARPPGSPLSFAASAGTLNSPFVTNTSGTVYQTTTTATPSAGGRDAFPFTINVAGAYTVVATVNATNNNANSLYVNIDSEPTDPANLWNIPVWNGFTNRPVTWNTSTTPHVFQLAAGQHQLIVRGHEAYTQLSGVAIVPVGAQLQLTMSSGFAVLTGIGQANHVYSIEASQNLKTWAAIGSVTADASGGISYLDTQAPSYSSRSYRLKDTTP